MRQIILIALNQLRITFSSRGALITAFVVPVTMAIAMGAALSDTGVNGQVIDVIHSADSADDLATTFVNLLRQQGKQQVQGKDRFIICDLTKPTEQPEGCKLTDLKSGDDLNAYAKRRVDDAVTIGSISLPANFSADLRAGNKVTATISAKGNLTNEQLIRQEVDAINARMGGALVAARVVTDKTNSNADFYNKVYTAAEATWAKDPIQINTTYSTVTGTSAGSGFGQSAPGMGAMFVLIGALSLGQVFMQERKNGTMQRLMVMPLSRGQILGGKLLGQYLQGVLTFALMLVVGAVFGVRWGDWPGAIVVMLVYTLAVTALGLFFSTIARTSGQVQGMGLLASMILAPLGGAWWPIDLVPTWMQQLGRISPIYWSQDAFSKMIFYGAKLPDILPNIVVLLLFAAVCFALGIRRFQYE
jgi:ABC-type multidrug transport system permease subunit